MAENARDVLADAMLEWLKQMAPAGRPDILLGANAGYRREVAERFLAALDAAGLAVAPKVTPPNPTTEAPD